MFVASFSTKGKEVGGEVYFSQAFIILSSSGVKENAGKAFNIFLFSKYVSLIAILALSFVSNGLLPVKNDLHFSRRQATAIKKRLVCLEGGFLPKLSAIVSCNFLNDQLSPLIIKRSSLISLSINSK